MYIHKNHPDILFDDRYPNSTHYTIDGKLITSGDLEISLDYGLNVTGYVFVGGSIISNVPLSSDSDIRVVGSINVQGSLVAHHISAGESIKTSNYLSALYTIFAGYYEPYNSYLDPVLLGLKRPDADIEDSLSYQNGNRSYKTNCFIKSGSSIYCGTILGCGGKIYAGLDEKNEEEIRCERLENGIIKKGNFVLDRSREIREKENEKSTTIAVIIILIIILIGLLSGWYK